MPKVTKESLGDVEDLLYHGYLEEDVFIGDWCLSFRTLSTAEERELWVCYRNVAVEHQVYFVLDLLAISLHRVNGRRLNDRTAAWEFFWGLPRSLLLSLYRLYRVKLTGRTRKAQGAVDEYSESTGSRSLWGAFKVTGSLPSPDFDFRNSNLVQHLWFVVNHYRDERDSEKSAWKRSEFVADQICMFLDPKGFRQMRTKRDSQGAKTKQKDYDAEVDVLTDIMEMMLPDDRREFAASIGNTDPEDLTMFLDKLPQHSLESSGEYKERVCAALDRACDILDREDTVHAGIMQEKSEAMVVGFLREQRAKLALRNLRLLIEIMGAEKLEMASRQDMLDEVDIAISERGSGYSLRMPDDRAHYQVIMRCEGDYKHVAFVPTDRREELLTGVIDEDFVVLVQAIEPNVDPYLLRKANSDFDTGPRGDGDGPPRPPPPPESAPPPPDVTGSAAAPEPASARLDIANLVHEMAEEYRGRHPGVDDVAKRIETEYMEPETLGDWQDVGRRKVAAEPPLPGDVNAITEAAKRQAADNKEYGLEEADQKETRRESALGRRNDALEALNRAKRKAGVTPETEKKAFLEDIRRIAQGQPPLEPPEPPQQRPKRPGESGG